MILYESPLIQIDFKIYLKEKSYLNPYSCVFSFELRKCIPYEKAICHPSKNLYF